MLHFEPKNISVPELHKLLLGGVAPRPIALVSTLSKDGIPNLSPFSFFNAFGANPPIIAFSPARRGKDASLKDTYNNLTDTKECVVQSVTYSMVEQISLASSEFSSNVDEFIKSGLTPIKSNLVKPFRVKESPFQMECKLLEMKNYGEKGGSANLAVCEVIKLHIKKEVMKDGNIEPNLIDLVSRMSANYYCRANGESIFVVEKPGSNVGVGFDNIPEFIKKSDIFSANDLAKFAGISSIPTIEEVLKFKTKIEKEHYNIKLTLEKDFFEYQNLNDYKSMLIISLKLLKTNKDDKKYLEYSAKCALQNNDKEFAWKTALLQENIS
ncbi:MAG: flavin reductase [Ignavibacteriales bacterium CG_4_9_14_3_um_filter_30_11]|nr:MAG: flavin reductase [Ignavibacteriales bacterium CG_4_9_14_3_um_filter_30_11]